MSLVSACAQTEALIARARSLFAAGAQPTPAPAETSAALRRAEGAAGAGAQMSELSGDLVDQHGFFVNRSAASLTTSAHTDAVLGTQLSHAAVLTHSGASQLDALAAEARATSQAAATARTPAAQHAVLTALTSQVARAQAIVGSAQQAAAQLAASTRALRYSRTVPSGREDQIVSDDAHHKVQPVDHGKNPAPPPPRPGQPVDPAFVGDWRFGHWEDVPPAPPYVGAPPPLKDEFRPLPAGTPLTVGPTTGMYTPGKSWIGDIDPPMVQGQEEYRFRLSGTDATTITRMVNVNGVWQQQRWVQNVYEYQRNTSMVFGGDIGLKGIDGESGDLGGLPPIQNFDRHWHPITLPQIATLSARNADTTYYLPNGCGGTIDFEGGVTPADPGAPRGFRS